MDGDYREDDDMKSIYISHVYGGNQDNKDKVEAIIKQLVKQHPHYLFISPIHALGYLYDEVDYNTGIKMCLELLKHCDEMWVCSELSRGVLMEKDYCISHNIEVIECH